MSVAGRVDALERVALDVLGAEIAQRVEREDRQREGRRAQRPRQRAQPALERVGQHERGHGLAGDAAHEAGQQQRAPQRAVRARVGRAFRRRGRAQLVQRLHGAQRGVPEREAGRGASARRRIRSGFARGRSASSCPRAGPAATSSRSRPTSSGTAPTPQDRPVAGDRLDDHARSPALGFALCSTISYALSYMSCAESTTRKVVLLLVAGDVERVAEVQPHRLALRRVVDEIGPDELRGACVVALVDAHRPLRKRDAELAAQVAERHERARLSAACRDRLVAAW